MIHAAEAKRTTGWIAIFCLALGLLCSSAALAGEAPPAPEMPANWKIISDWSVPAQQVSAMSAKLGADLSSVRNTVYDVNGHRVQLNLIVTPDPANAAKLMNKLKSIKTEEALLRKGLAIYEFVGQNDALPAIAQGRKHLQ